MKIVIKRDGFKVKIKISSYEMYKLNLTQDKLQDMIRGVLKYEICKDNH